MGTTRLSAEGAVGRGLSPAIWQAHGFIGSLDNDPSRRGFFFDDFAEGTSYAAEDSAKYSVFADSTAVLSEDPDGPDLSEGEFGVCRFNSDGGDNDQLSIQMGGGVGGLVKIDDTAGENGVVAFECRIKVTTITTGDQRFFFGLAEEARSVDNGIHADGATFADVDYLGFTNTEGDGASIIRQFHKASGTLDAQDTGQDLVADTWIKLGFLYDPEAASAEKIKFYINGSEVTNFGDVRCDATDLADDTNFPAGEEMSPIILMKNTANTATTDYLYVDWWAVGQGFTG